MQVIEDVYLQDTFYGLSTSETGFTGSITRIKEMLNAAGKETMSLGSAATDPIVHTIVNADMNEMTTRVSRQAQTTTI